MVTAMNNDLILSRIKNDGTYVTLQGSNESLQDIWLREMQSVLNMADKDNISGLSKDELSSISSDKDIDKKILSSLTEQFDYLDENKDGQLSTEEMRNVKLATMGPPPGMNIKGIDGDGSNTKSYSSLLEALTNASYDVLDANKDGVISLDELTTAGGSNDKNSNAVKSFIDKFDEFDINSDGKLSKDEFAKAMEGVIAGKQNADTGSELKNSIKNLASDFLQKLIDTYKDVGVKSLTSSLGSLV